MHCRMQAVATYLARRKAWADAPKTRMCPGLVKSDIVFFGEKTQGVIGADLLGEAELLIVMGTSLQVMPFASTSKVKHATLSSHAPAHVCTLSHTCVLNHDSLVRGVGVWFPQRVQV